MSDENYSKLRKTLKFLEDPRYPSVGPHLRYLWLIGVWHPTPSRYSNVMLTLFYIVLLLFSTQYIRAIINFHYASLSLIILHAPYHMGLVKCIWFLRYHKVWKDLIYYSSSLERKQLSEENNNLDKLINGYINWNRCISYFFWSMSVVSMVMMFSPLYRTRIESSTNLIMFDFYIPFCNMSTSYSFLHVQTFGGLMSSQYVISWDMFVVALMIFFKGQLQIAKVFCTNLIDSTNNEKSQKNIAEFHQHYVTLIRYQNIFADLISPVMFIYLIIVCSNIGGIITEIVQAKDDKANLLRAIEYISACFVQLFFFYWHANDVTEESLTVSYGVFESDWTSADKKVRKGLVLLSALTSKRLVFKSGLFSEMSLSTFIGIVRGSYSYYTLLNGTN